MNIDTTITIDTLLNTGLALLGWFYIMFSAGKWAASVFLKQWGKRRKQEKRQKALEAFYDAFELSRIEPGTTARITPDGWVMVPKQVTPEISNAINVVGQRCTCGNCSQRLWDLLLDATQQGVNRG